MKKGFTLIELILAMVIGTVIVGTAATLYIGLMREYNEILEKQQINNEFMRVEQNLIKQVVADHTPMSLLKKPAATCTVSITVDADNLLHINCSAINQQTKEEYQSQLILTPRS